MKTTLRVVLACALVFVSGVATMRLLAQLKGAVAPKAPVSEGETLERQMWADFKAKNWASVEAKIAPNFQSVHPDGPRDRAGELTLLKGLKVGAEYTFKDFKVTQDGDTLVVAYWISVQETIDGKALSSKPAMRLSIWKKNATGWQWIAHANLNPI